MLDAANLLAEKIIKSDITALSISGAADLGKSHLAKRVVTELRDKGLDAA